LNLIENISLQVYTSNRTYHITHMTGQTENNYLQVCYEYINVNTNIDTNSNIII